MEGIDRDAKPVVNGHGVTYLVNGPYSMPIAPWICWHRFVDGKPTEDARFDTKPQAVKFGEELRA